MRRLLTHLAVGVVVAGSAAGVVGTQLSSSSAAATAAPAVGAPAPSAATVAAAAQVAGNAAAAEEYRRISRSAPRTALTTQTTRTAAATRASQLTAQRHHIEQQAEAIQARQAAARLAAEKARKAKVAKLGYTEGTTDPRSIARQMMANQYGWGDDQFACYNNIIMRESMWVATASNPSGAYGIPQSLPGDKMASAGADWRTNPATQIRWGLSYVKSTYGTPCSAWGFKSSHGWY